MSAADIIAPPLRRATRVAYGFGAIADGIKSAAFSTYLLLYFNQVLGVSAAIVSTAIALTLVVDAVADPLIGRVSDLTRSRLGRRHPYIYGAALPTALFFALTWFPPQGLTRLRDGRVDLRLRRAGAHVHEHLPGARQRARQRADAGLCRAHAGSTACAIGSPTPGTFAFTAFALEVLLRRDARISQGPAQSRGLRALRADRRGARSSSASWCAAGARARASPTSARPKTGPRRPGCMTHLKEMGSAFRNRAFLTDLRLRDLQVDRDRPLRRDLALFRHLRLPAELGPACAAYARRASWPCASRCRSRRSSRGGGASAMSALWLALFGVDARHQPRCVLTYFDLFFAPGPPAAAADAAGDRRGLRRDGRDQR